LKTQSRGSHAVHTAGSMFSSAQLHYVADVLRYLWETTSSQYNLEADAESQLTSVLATLACDIFLVETITGQHVSDAFGFSAQSRCERVDRC
jgi:hypothetical protein